MSEQYTCSGCKSKFHSAHIESSYPHPVNLTFGHIQGILRVWSFRTVYLFGSNKTVKVIRPIQITLFSSYPLPVIIPQMAFSLYRITNPHVSFMFGQFRNIFLFGSAGWNTARKAQKLTKIVLKPFIQCPKYLEQRSLSASPELNSIHLALNW